VEQERKILEQGKLLNDCGKRLIQLEHKVGVLMQSKPVDQPNPASDVLMNTGTRQIKRPLQSGIFSFRLFLFKQTFLYFIDSFFFQMTMELPQSRDVVNAFNQNEDCSVVRITEEKPKYDVV